MKINGNKLREYVKNEKIMEFGSWEELLFFQVNNCFEGLRTIDELKDFMGEYAFEYNGKVYDVMYDDAFDVYELGVSKINNKVCPDVIDLHFGYNIVLPNAKVRLDSDGENIYLDIVGSPNVSDSFPIAMIEYTDSPIEADDTHWTWATLEKVWCDLKDEGYAWAKHYGIPFVYEDKPTNHIYSQDADEEYIILTETTKFEGNVVDVKRERIRTKFIAMNEMERKITEHIHNAFVNDDEVESNIGHLGGYVQWADTKVEYKIDEYFDEHYLKVAEMLADIQDDINKVGTEKSETVYGKEICIKYNGKELKLGFGAAEAQGLEDYLQCIIDEM